jgi:hypothetical protein
VIIADRSAVSWASADELARRVATRRSRRMVVGEEMENLERDPGTMPESRK